ncbi:RtcB family protein [Candidatus Woesearchaeota archaeon]|nr:RtcB family protein [Candidatus Woesearchaeota archaeon]
MQEQYLKQLKKVNEVEWEVPTSFKKEMRVPGLIFATDNLIREMDDAVIDQLTNVATLPGIQKYAYCMPDAHSGYGFPIGGVAAFDPKEDGVISPGGVGFDINCGMRLIKTNLTLKELQPKLKEIVDLLFNMVPAGVGGKGFVKLTRSELDEVITKGVKWCVNQGYGWKDDIKNIEAEGCIEWADASKVSDKAKSRGIAQLGTLGSGNHYLEIQVAKKENISDQKIAKKLGIDEEDQVIIMVHCGSRGFGHQIGTDYLKLCLDKMSNYGIKILDRELACAPFESKEGQDYFKAMACGANLAFANRQVIVHQIREAFRKIFKQDPKDMGMDVIYDVAHNIAKLEKHNVDGKKKELIVHRKGATRCFGPSREEMTGLFKEIGQPVIVGGSMETGSYLLIGQDGSEEKTFGSTMHGSGRTMSRTQAKKQIRGDKLQKEMLQHGIYVKAVSMPGLAEEAGVAYKDINEVVDTMEFAGVSKKVALLKPIGNVKG